MGSWTGSRYFSNLVATSEGRSTFGYEIANFMYTNGFYGVDIDWEYRTCLESMVKWGND